MTHPTTAGAQAVITDEREALRELLDAGQQLSNMAFNLAQREGEPLPSRTAATLREVCALWDQARRNYRAALAPSPASTQPEAAKADAVDAKQKLRNLAVEIRSYVKADWRPDLDLLDDWAEAIDAAIASQEKPHE